MNKERFEKEVIAEIEKYTLAVSVVKSYLWVK